jgi:hypothetical protein
VGASRIVIERRKRPKGLQWLPDCARGRLLVQLVIDASAGEPAHVVFRFHGGRETPLAGKFEVLPIRKVDVSLPCPSFSVAVFSDDANEGLITVSISDPVS